MSTTVSSSIEIHATPQQVWSVLTAFEAYGSWNPFMDRIEGRPEVGSRLVVHMSPPGGRGMTFKPVVLAATAPRELRWLGKLWPGGLFDGEHSFLLEPTETGGTELVHSETFRGILVALFKGTLSKTDDGFEAFNSALKARVEKAEEDPTQP